MTLTTFSCSTPESVFDDWYSDTHEEELEEDIPDYDIMSDTDTL